MQDSSAIQQPDWAAGLPDPILFFDVETTGFTIEDRIVSLGSVLVSFRDTSASTLLLEFGHFIFDPGIGSHREAERVHGLDDWTLRHQEPFSAQAGRIADWVNRAALVVAHNIEFDLFFLLRDMSAAGVALPRRKLACTMAEWRKRHEGRSNLSTVAATLGLPRNDAQHGAMEDAWLCAAAWLHLHTPISLPPLPATAPARPMNFIEPPPRPARLPKRPTLPA